MNIKHLNSPLYFFPQHPIRFKKWNSIVTKAQQYSKYLNIAKLFIIMKDLGKSTLCLLGGKLKLQMSIFWVYSFVLIGFRFSDSRCLIIKAKIESIFPVTDEVCHGLLMLSCYGLIDAIKHNSEVLRIVFVKIGILTWHYDPFVRSFKPMFIEEAGNKKTV